MGAQDNFIYCPNCGFKNNDSANYCMNCGFKIPVKPNVEETAVRASTQETPARSAFNRDVLIAYLYQLRSMEFSRRKINNKLQNMQQRIDQLGCYKDLGKPSNPSSQCPGFLSAFFEGIIEYGCLAFICFIVAAVVGWFGDLIGAELLEMISAFALLGGIGSVILIFVHAMGEVERGNEKKEKYEQELRDYEIAVENDQKRVEKEMERKKELQKAKNSLKEYYTESNKVLQKMYDVNLIPKQFRNIYAIYYFYEYISTSQSDLESAMLHFNLEEIKVKLDQVIANQQEIILNQALQRSQTEQLISQNNELIEYAIETERNTKNAMQYAEIAAANAESIEFTNRVMATIMVGKYFGS